MTESTYARQRRDERTADDALGSGARLRCQAHGCPNCWSVDAGSGRCCSAHAWVGRHLWPQVTQEQLDAETNRARAAMGGTQSGPAYTRDPARLAKALVALASPKEDGLLWAKRLQWYEEKRGGRLRSGQLMTQVQRDIWRRALRFRGGVESEPAAAADSARAHLPNPQQQEVA